MKIFLFSFLIVTFSWSSDACMYLLFEFINLFLLHFIYNVSCIFFLYLVVKSVKEKIGESPWHVGVYEDRLYRCGGTILTKKIVISGK